MPIEIERNLARILKAEVDGIKQLKQERAMIKCRYDFSRLECFKSIDNYKMSCFMRDDIREFINRNGLYATSLDSDNAMRRLDQDKDGRVTYSEFCYFFDKHDKSGGKSKEKEDLYSTPRKNAS